MTMNVLLVEDDEYVRDLIEHIVEPRGYQLVTFGDGESAWAACQRRHFPLMLLDWGLPGIDGLELCRRIRSLPDGDHSVILVITARDEPRALQEVLQAGASDYLAKPFDVHLLETRLTIAERQVEVLAERRRAEAALRDANKKLQALISAAPVAIIGFDPDCVVRSWNPAAERIFGWAWPEVLGQRPTAIAGILDTISRAITGAASPAAVVDVELSQVRRDGTTITLSLSASPVYDSHRRLAGVMAVAVDITARKQAEKDAEQQFKALAETEKFRALGQMASGVAHDLNQYLGAVAGHGDLALRYLERPVVDVNAVRDSLEIVIRAAMDGAEAVKRLLAFSRPRQDGNPIQVDLGELLRDVAKLTAPIWRDASQAQGRPISLHVEAAGDTVVAGWPASLKEAFTNLVFNAVDAMPHGGTIRLRALRQGPRVIAEVTDSGVGMTPEIQANLFTPFFSTKGERGSGLGMSIVYGIVERHVGLITIDSAPGRGSTFRLSFPAAHDLVPSDIAQPIAANARPLRILAVDDDPVLVNMVASMLQIDGHVVAVATSGEAAVERLEQEQFDLVLSDVGMGAGMNGWELAAHVRAQDPGAHVVLVTGWGAQIESDEIEERGVDAVIAKPYRITDLRRVVGAVSTSESAS